MATSEEIAYAEKLRELLLTAASYPAEYYLAEGEYFSISIVDCYGRTLVQTPLRPAKAAFPEKNMEVQTDCRSGVKMYLTFYKFSSGQVQPSVNTRKVKVQGEYVYSVGKLARVVRFRTPSKGTNSLGHLLHVAGMTVRRRFKRLSRVVGKSNPPRPSTESETRSWNYFRHRSGATVPGSPQVTTAVMPYTSYSRTWTGVRTPNYLRLKKQGRLPVNPHTVSIYTRSDPSTYYSVYERTWKILTWRIDTFYSWGSLNWAEEPVFNTVTLNKAISRLASRGGSKIEGNLNLTLAEGGMTVAMIGKTIGRLSGAFGNLKRGNVNGAVKALWQGKNPRYRKGGGPSTLYSAAENWLELQYGWKPLLSDIEGGLNSLSAYFKAQKGAYFQLTGSASSKSETVQVLTDDGSHLEEIGSLYIVDTHRARVGIRFTIEDELLAFLSSTGFTNPLNLAWEVIPFSFVLDWFVPVGPYLEALSNWHGLKFVDGYQVQYAKKRKFGYMSSDFYELSSNTDRSYHGRAESEWVKVSREKLSDFPGTKIPSLRNPLSTTRAVNALSLLKVVMGR